MGAPLFGVMADCKMQVTAIPLLTAAGKIGAPTKEELMRHAPRALARLVHYLRQDYACLQFPVPNITEAGALA